MMTRSEFLQTARMKEYKYDTAKSYSSTFAVTEKRKMEKLVWFCESEM